MKTVICVPPWEACQAYFQGHFCHLTPRHAVLYHECECQTTWPADRNYELAFLLYMEHWTTRYKDELYRPPLAAAEAACRPLNSPWRALAAIAENYLKEGR